ncbi:MULTISPECIES: hypothetical protein [unclassified Novosphingobium]|uniref:hypothetical protein n=1 Tax=unclassified Novosphingobium TaxID=2644732 RepID=UPI001AC1FF2E|nr:MULTISPECIES: hypothetical protein [unclassified Novosphingobium]MBN9145176.1 hypothetical protein [Novosphingobium sp.]MDR6709552.1 hypothetical protein [Novosphingobium sp. 1748]
MDNADPANSAAYWAVIEHHRTWIAGDGIHFLQIHRDHGGTMPLNIAQRIANDYGVIRTIGSHMSGNDKQALPNLLNRISQAEWPDCLIKRAEVCLKIAKEHREVRKEEVNKKSHAPVSGVTKIMWFIRPKGWTMFDRFARIGLIGGQNSAMAFYKQLSNSGFLDLAYEINNLCRFHGFNDLWGERIIDKFLLARGSWPSRVNGFDGGLAEAKVVGNWYLHMQHPDVEKRLVSLAADVAQILNDTSLPMNSTDLK